MGACEFTQTAYGRTEAEAFDSAVRDAQYESGHGGYSGTVAEKNGSGFISFGWAKTRKSARRIVEQILGADYDYDADDPVLRLPEHLEPKRRQIEEVQDKWGPAGILRVGDGSRAGKRPSQSWHYDSNGKMVDEPSHTCACGREFDSEVGLGLHRRSCDVQEYVIFGWASS